MIFKRGLLELQTLRVNSGTVTKMLRFQLHILMAEKGPGRPYRISEIARMTGLQANTVSAVYNNRAKRIDLATIESLCQALECTPADLFLYNPDSDPPPDSPTKGELPP